MLNRRSALLSLTLALPTAPAFALQRRSVGDPMRLGVDSSLVESGLGRALEVGFARDTGIALQLIATPALPLLEALKNGELDVGLTNTPDAELRLDREGLVHDHQPIAAGEFLIVGPAPARKSPDPLAGLPPHDAVAVVRKLADLGATGAEPKVVVLTAGDGSGAHVAEQALWRDARIAPAGAWYVAAPPGLSLIAQARALGAYALVERGAWLAAGGPPLAVRLDGDARLVEQVHVMRSFRTTHPAGKLFVKWIAGGLGRRVVAAQRGYRVTTAR